MTSYDMSYDNVCESGSRGGRWLYAKAGDGRIGGVT